ncbi:SDR family NAD(P)-dependent oxidoreductase [Aquibium sp. ELW1220]|uniref:SDR family NAD(P)-dependent oxidoreductase n=1 Tax=Aquibium sp. ELW1220 TaxID=2976766 RepID=UPI0025B12963|nr:SDR family NAD(P)-dependent oxidoreductase [Aquibium sp. ELW1220]MDN2581142.1 SDR family oxidoreductase [Aquibium sp. ELW1220]
MTISLPHALVTGGATGIGKATALALAEAGVEVTICGRRAEPLEAVAAMHPRIHAMTADVTDEASVEALYRKAEAARGPIEIVVANAGIASSAPAHKTTLAEWNRIIEVNLTGAFLTVRPALAGMAERMRGRLIFIASVAGLRGSAYVAPYVASKHGVVGLMRALAAELLKTGVTVNAICPGYVETEMLEESIARVMEKTGRSEEQAREGFAAFNPNQRLIKPEEVAAAVLWLASDAAISVTGQPVAISGG